MNTRPLIDLSLGHWQQAVQAAHLISSVATAVALNSEVRLYRTGLSRAYIKPDSRSPARNKDERPFAQTSDRSGG